MRHGVAVWMGCGVLLLCGVTMAGARGGRELGDEELRAEMTRNRALAAYVARNGNPDLAESHLLADRPPWDDHEVTLYYLVMRKEIGFARAWILDRPEIQIERYERPLTDAQVASLSMRAHKPRVGPADPPDPRVGPAERAEDAARRAEGAAERIDAAADSAERAAERAEAAGNQMESAFHRALRK